ncbi:hypothetical protein ATO6_18665 [Oceanicola sp. 22II-s10i]|uniref:gamma-glutamylcyclotransferase n=1 Tax=Oceanicola sp. 22II-s10i TaxID=1317116 RepID=UPI000B5222D2|nr:gamma-glutamylcyclotransferase [Oceanicola sp. 22II-s10i]OWU83466.1 hypothetical protein ATO6_18665 [Oceanicola sp. 22II-s10i]
MPLIFVYGTLRHLPLLDLVAGVAVSGRAARLPGYRVVAAKGEDYPMPLADPGASATGLLCEVSETAFARLDWYETAFGYNAAPLDVETDGGTVSAQVWLPDPGAEAPGGDWDLSRWTAGWADLTMIAAAEAMELFGRVPAAQIGQFWHMFQGRADARLRAGRMERPRIGSDVDRRAVTHVASEIGHAGYFVTRTDILRHPTFSGGMSAELRREMFVAGDAAIVLPYDPVRDRILLVEQFRMGPWGRGARYPFMLEPVAGRLDPGEEPETCARRETEEEAGVKLNALIKVASYYPSPGYLTEYFHTYVGLCDLPDGTETNTGGLDTEDEDIRTHVLSFDTAMDLLSSGEADNGPLIHLLTWLKAERPGLRATA